MGPHWKTSLTFLLCGTIQMLRKLRLWSNALGEGLRIDEVGLDGYEPIITSISPNSTHKRCLRNRVSSHDWEIGLLWKYLLSSFIFFLSVNLCLWKHCLLKEAYSKMIYKLWSSLFNSVLNLGKISRNRTFN